VLTPGAPVEELFCELVAIPSPSGRERAVGEAIAEWLAAAGVDAAFDGAGAENGSDAGNLIARLPGAPDAPVLLFVAHMDTVESGAEAVAPVTGDDGVIRSAGDTILGADNKSAVAAVMRTLARAAAAAGGSTAAGSTAAGTTAAGTTARPTVVGAFTCREEAGRMGVSLLDPALVAEVDCAFSVDGSSPIGTVITRALGQQVFSVLVHGRAAHAAADPGAGVSAIAVAAEAIGAMELGRLPGGGSASIASIAGGALLDHLGHLDHLGRVGRVGRVDGLDRPGPGGPAADRDRVRAALESTPTNSVPDLVMLRGEVRGYSAEEIAGARAALERAVAGACAAHGATYEWIDRERAVPPFPGAPDSCALALARAACERVDGARFSVAEAHATLEANYLCAGADVVALASGGRDAHQYTESITVAELRALEALLGAIVEQAAPC
jgi:tripeptide aminopeptidase